MQQSFNVENIVLRKKRGSLLKSSKVILRKTFILLLNYLFNHHHFYKLLGILNERTNLIASLFVAYPASEEYALAYSFRSYLHLIKWSPYLLGIFKQNGKWGIMYAISSTEKDFLNPENEKALTYLVDKVERIRKVVGTPQKTFAGILPGVLFAKRIIRETVEIDVTVEAIIKAEERVRYLENYDNDVPVIVLGGKGFVGRRVIPKFHNREVCCVDVVKTHGTQDTWPYHLEGKEAILINITKKAALTNYLNLFWPELILINEVYPEPSQKEVERLKAIGSPAYHIVGIEAKAFPPFPKAYTGGVPCCAGIYSENIKVLVKKLD